MRIAQLTDLHMRSKTWGPCAQPARLSHEMVRLFSLALEQIKQHNIDLLAVTGDLVDVPSWIEHPVAGFEYESTDPWQQAAIADYTLLRKLLDDSGLQYMVLPGNHDMASLMWQVFDRDANEVEVAGYRVIRFCDFEHEHNQAHRYVPQRDRFNEVTSQTDGLPQIHLQHYLLDSDHNTGYPHGYAEADFLRKTLAQSARVKLSLSGHYHRGVELAKDGNCWFAAGPAFCQLPFTWREYELTNGGEQCTVTDHSLGEDALPKRPVVFLDRDGVINDMPSYRVGQEKMNLIAGSAAAIRKLNDAGYAVVVITSQSAVGMGYVPRKVMFSANDRMCRLLAEEAGAKLDAIYASVCAGEAAALPGYDDLEEAKPRPTLLLRAADQLHLDLAGSYMVGDSFTDAGAGAAAGATPIHVRTGNGKGYEADFRRAYPDSAVVDDLAAAVDVICAR